MIEMNKLQFYQHNPLVAKSDYIKWSDRQETDQGQIDPKIGRAVRIKKLFSANSRDWENVKGKKSKSFSCLPFLLCITFPQNTLHWTFGPFLVRSNGTMKKTPHYFEFAGRNLSM